jgi:hypothetical protein
MILSRQDSGKVASRSRAEKKGAKVRKKGRCYS